MRSVLLLVMGSDKKNMYSVIEKISILVGGNNNFIGLGEK